MNTALVKRIEQGLTLAMADGSFDALFFGGEGIRRGQQELEKGSRHLLTLNMNYAPVNSELPLSH